MTELSSSHQVLAAGAWTKADDQVVLSYEDRFLRRKRLVTAKGAGFLVDLAEVTNLLGGEAFLLGDGQVVEILPAREPVLIVRGDLARLAWHIGNRHTPCQIESDRLVIRADHVLEGMLKGLGAKVSAAMEPFRPESGAYGMGRTMGHDHGGHDHSGLNHGPVGGFEAWRPT